MRISVAQSKYFDAWRGGLAIIVAFAHTFQIYSSQYSKFFIVLTGALGGAAVSGFFVLSGFFIHKSLWANVIDGNVNSYSYLASRINRIIPPFLFALTLTAFLYLLSPLLFPSGSNHFTIPSDRKGFYLTGFIDSAFFIDIFTRETLSANGPLWSLTIEVWCYLVSLLYVLLKNKKFIGCLLFPVIISIAYFNPFFFLYFSLWFFGYLISHFHSSGRLPRISENRFKILTLIPLFSFLFIFVAPSIMLTKVGVIFQYIFGIWYIFHMILVLVRDDNNAWVPLVFAGKFSYTLYISHFPLILFFYGIGFDSTVSFIVAIFLAMFFSRYVEAIKIFDVSRK